MPGVYENRCSVTACPTRTRAERRVPAGVNVKDPHTRIGLGGKVIAIKESEAEYPLFIPAFQRNARRRYPASIGTQNERRGSFLEQRG